MWVFITHGYDTVCESFRPFLGTGVSSLIFIIIHFIYDSVHPIHNRSFSLRHSPLIPLGSHPSLQKQIWSPSPRGDSSVWHVSRFPPFPCSLHGTHLSLVRPTLLFTSLVIPSFYGWCKTLVFRQVSLSSSHVLPFSSFTSVSPFSLSLTRTWMSGNIPETEKDSLYPSVATHLFITLRWIYKFLSVTEDQTVI